MLKAAETASQLAGAVSTPADAHILFQMSADMYEILVDNASPENRRSLRYRMAVAMRSAGRQQEAFRIFDQMLQEKPNVFDLQFEAARTLQAWGTAEQNAEHLHHAVDGIADQPHVWGWRKMARTLQKLMTRQDAKPDYPDRFLEARNGIAQCRLHIAATLQDKAMQISELENAATEIRLLAMQAKSPENSGWKRLEASYQQILSGLGRPAEPLFAPQP